MCAVVNDRLLLRINDIPLQCLLQTTVPNFLLKPQPTIGAVQRRFAQWTLSDTRDFCSKCTVDSSYSKHYCIACSSACWAAVDMYSRGMANSGTKFPRPVHKIPRRANAGAKPTACSRAPKSGPDRTNFALTLVVVGVRKAIYALAADVFGTCRPQLGQKNELGKELYFSSCTRSTEWLPDSFWNFPARQGSHSLLIWYLPSGKLRQKPQSETRPILHGRHIGTAVLLNLKPGSHVLLTGGPITLSSEDSGLLFSEIWHWWHSNLQSTIGKYSTSKA